MFPIEKYHFYYDGDRKIIAVSTYAGKTVRGIAICHKDDEFDLEKGKKLAAARCAIKIAKKRVNRACDKVEEAWEAASRADKNLTKAQRYSEDAEWELEEAYRNLNGIIYAMS